MLQPTEAEMKRNLIEVLDLGQPGEPLLGWGVTLVATLVSKASESHIGTSSCVMSEAVSYLRRQCGSYTSVGYGRRVVSPRPSETVERFLVLFPH